MPGYLDQYGAGEERRNRIVATSIISILAVVAVSGLGWYLFKNHHQESVVKTFVDAVKRGDYPSAYQDWGCTAAKPCSGYALKNLMEDWGRGPGSGAKAGAEPDPAVLGITDSESCNNGVLLTVKVNASRVERLWVDKSSDAISFAPYPICPHKSPYAIMLHRTIGQLRKPLLH